MAALHRRSLAATIGSDQLMRSKADDNTKGIINDSRSCRFLDDRRGGARS